MKIITYFSFLLLFSTFTACQKNNDDLPAVDKTIPASELNQGLLLKLVNDVRTQGCTCGTTTMPAVAPLQWNVLLEEAAYEHSSDMAQNDYFDHVAPDGSTPADRITKTGYNWTSLGENIAFNYPNESSAIAGWIQSEGHCRNIMSPDFTEMGVRKVGQYWTQVFGSR